MDEKTLLMLSFLVGGIGLSILYGVFVNSEPLQVKFIEEHLGETIAINGRVVSVNQLDGRMEVVVLREEYVSVTFFDDVSTFEGSDVKITGEVQEFNGRRSLIGESLEQT